MMSIDILNNSDQLNGIWAAYMQGEVDSSSEEEDNEENNEEDNYNFFDRGVYR